MEGGAKAVLFISQQLPNLYKAYQEYAGKIGVDNYVVLDEHDGFNKAVNRGPKAFADFIREFEGITGIRGRRLSQCWRLQLIIFAIVFLSLLTVVVIVQVLTKMRIVGGNELGVISGVGKAGFRFLSGGRAFPIPLLNTFDRMDLTPHTIEVKVESAIAAKIVPLNVTATVSFAIANNETGRRRALTRILAMAKDSRRLISVATNIIEGHLRDSISSLTPEQVMSDKDTLVAKMINACKSDLENIGLFITTMNIADVDDNRLDGVDEPEMYIALLKRVKTVQAETTARKAMADSHAQAAMERERRLAEVQVTELENQLEQLKAETELLVATEKQKEIVGVKDASEKARSDVAGYTERLIAEKANIGRLRTQYEAEIITPALAQKEKMILNARAESDQVPGHGSGGDRSVGKKPCVLSPPADRPAWIRL
jgi:flotillin